MPFFRKMWARMRFARKNSASGNARLKSGELRIRAVSKPVRQSWFARRRAAKKAQLAAVARPVLQKIVKKTIKRDQLIRDFVQDEVRKKIKRDGKFKTLREQEDFVNAMRTEAFRGSGVQKAQSEINGLFLELEKKTKFQKNAAKNSGQRVAELSARIKDIRQQPGFWGANAELEELIVQRDYIKKNFSNPHTLAGALQVFLGSEYRITNEPDALFFGKGPKGLGYLGIVRNKEKAAVRKAA